VRHHRLFLNGPRLDLGPLQLALGPRCFAHDYGVGALADNEPIVGLPRETRVEVNGVSVCAWSWTRAFSATGREYLESVVRTNRRTSLARMQWVIIKRVTVSSVQTWPRAFNAAVIRGPP
jgi:hypothetical protein